MVDIDPLTDNIDVTQLEGALSPRTRAVMIAHTLGNPFDVDAVQSFLPRPTIFGWSKTTATPSVPIWRPGGRAEARTGLVRPSLHRAASIRPTT